MANMLILFFGLILVLFMIFPAFPMESYGHRSGCHAAHSCPSDTGSYVCGDTGNYSQCPGNDSEENKEKSKKKKINRSDSIPVKSDAALSSKTISEGIEISGPVTNVVDGDTLDINDIRIRLSLVNTPEVGEPGFDSAKDFVESLCLDKNGQVDIDDGQRQGSFGREIGVVYCDGINLNSKLMSNGYALISAEFCDVSEFASEAWASSSCISNKSNENASSISSNKGASPLSTKEGQNGEVSKTNAEELDENYLGSEASEEITSSHSNSEKYVAVDKWGSLGVSEGQFNSPSSISYDPSNEVIYVADLENNRIQKFDTDGNFLMKWGLSGTSDGEFYHPGDIESDSSGNLYVADINNARIQKFDSEGNFIMKWGSSGEGDGQFDHPGDVIVDEANEAIYVTDIGNNRIQKFDSEGNFLTKWGSAGTGNGQFNRPAGMALDPNDEIIYVADTKNDQIQKFDKNGNFLSKWGSSGAGNGDFNRPTGIEFSSTNGILYVTDNDNKRIQVLDKNGNFLSKWGSDKNFERPTGIAVDELNRKAYVNDKANNNIQVFSIPEDPFVNLKYATSENNDNSGDKTSPDSKDKDNDSKDSDKDSDSKDSDKDNDSKDEESKDDGGDLDCSDFDKKNFKVQPGDPYDLDRDGDGIACED